MKKLTVFSLIISLAICCAHAQQAAPSPAGPASSPPPALPPGPLLKPVPDNTRWTVITTGKAPEIAKPEASPDKSPEAGKREEKDKAKGSTTTMVGEKVGQTAHVIIARANGAREEKWTDGTLVATVSSGASAPSFTTGGIEQMPVPTWVSAENFTEIKKQGDKSFLIFRTRIMPSGVEIVRDMEAEAHGQTQSTEHLKVDAMAVIDADTRLPLAVQEGKATTTYKYEQLPPNAQIIPPAIQTEIATRAQKVRAATRQPVRP
jgi:hypothetical protein